MSVPQVEKLSRSNPETLVPDLSKPNGACVLDADIIINTLLATSPTGPYAADLSFTRQITALTDEWETVGPDIPGPPKAMLFTVFSAIPFITMFQGYYQAAGSEAPLISYIKAGRNPSWQTQHAITTEANRLRELIDGMDHVCVVDEHVSTGRTLKLAHSILELTGATHTTAIRGIWDPYGVKGSEDDIDGLVAAAEASSGYLYDMGVAAHIIDPANKQPV